MKKIISLATCLSLLALLRSEPVYAADFLLTPDGGATAAFSAAASPKGVIQVGGDGICEVQIASAAGSTDTTATVYAAISATGTGPGQTLNNPTVWFQAANPSANDPLNYRFGACPNFIAGEVNPYGSGTIIIRVRSKK